MGKQPNGDIKFITQFYNGCCGLDEVFEYGIESVNQNEASELTQR